MKNENLGRKIEKLPLKNPEKSQTNKMKIDNVTTTMKEKVRFAVQRQSATTATFLFAVPKRMKKRGKILTNMIEGNLKFSLVIGYISQDPRNCMT